jgi:putative inorganic carbon (HCO3(-)) transporter
MSGIAANNPAPIKKGHSVHTVIAQILAAGLMIAEFTILEQLPLLLTGCVLTACGYFLWRQPQLTTLLVVFLVYTNLPVVAVKFHGFPASLPALVIGLLMWPLIHQIVALKNDIFLGSAFPWVLLFTIVQLLGALNSEYAVSSFEFFVSFLFEGLLLYLIVSNLIRTRERLRQVVWTLAFCAILMGGIPLLQQFTGAFETNFGGLAQLDSQFKTVTSSGEGVTKQNRMAGSIGEQNRYSQFMILLVPIGVSLYSMSRTRRSRIIAIIGACCALAGFALAFSRGGAIGFVLAILMGLCCRLITLRQFKWMAVASLLILMCFPQYLSRLASIASLNTSTPGAKAMLRNTEGSIRGRLTEMGAAGLVFRDHLILGVGPGVFREYSREYGQHIGLRALKGRRQAHCMPLEIAAENGLLGLLTFFPMLFFLLRRLVMINRRSTAVNDTEAIYLTSGLAMALLLYLSTSLFLHLSYIRYFWLLVAIADAAVGIFEKDQHAGNAEVASVS